MKSVISACCLAFALAVSLPAAQAGEPTPKQKAQREKMKTCNAEATAQGLKKKTERDKFMSECLKSDKNKGKAAKSGEKEGQTGALMKGVMQDAAKAETCKQEAKAKGLKGDARKLYLSSCMGE